MSGQGAVRLTGGIEPDDVGTRIEDGEGRRWVRVHPHGGPAPWWLIDADTECDSWAVWSAIPEPTMLTAAPVPPADETEPQAGASGDGGGLG